MHFLYDAFIAPLELLLEFFFKFVQVITGNAGLAVISLSFIVTILTLPLYMVAESWQEKERQIQNKLKSGIERIKQTFKGDEQYMMLSTFYRQQHYHPMMALRSSFSLLIQIPFFMAAYNFLSKLTVLQGYSFLFIKDFGAPDASLKLGNFSINILPVAMTLINCIAGYIYSKGHGIKEQLQIYGCALVFLLLLYKSPAGLVVYWTMNNILSLVKNIFYKLKNPKKVIYIICCILGLVSVILLFTKLRNIDKIYKCAFLLFSVLLFTYPYLIKVISGFFTKTLEPLNTDPSKRLSVFLFSAIILTVLAGLVIPSILIESQPDLYCYVDDYSSPFPFIIKTFAKALGFFFIWPLCFYALFGSKTKNFLSFIFFFASAFTIINTFCFSGNYGSIEPTLIFMEPQNFKPTILNILINFVILAVLCLIIILIIKKKILLLNYFAGILLFALITISSINVIHIGRAFSKMEAPDNSASLKPIYKLSKTGKNVIVFMQDACFSPFVSEIFEKDPELKNHFTGFTYYPNTTPLGSVTMTGSPGLFAGYDYTPYEINKRDDKTLQQKHNEALLTLPILFNSQKFSVTVSNLPYENYLEEPVTDMYKGYEYINRINTQGKYSGIWYKRYGLERNPHTSFLINRNFICFSFFKMVPPLLRAVIYSHEYWIANDPYEDTATFVNSYSSMDFLSELTDFSSAQDSFLLIDNEATHANGYVDNSGVKVLTQSQYAGDDIFDINNAVLQQYAEFFDYLKQNGVYDNTRIIIVSDHGKNVNRNYFPNLFNPKLTSTLLVKDFNSQNELIIDNTFMTNADTPYLATAQIIEDAKNPFTNNPLQVQDKNEYIKIAVPNSESTRIRHNTKFKINPENWYTVHDDIYKKENWSRLEK